MSDNSVSGLKTIEKEVNNNVESVGRESRAAQEVGVRSYPGQPTQAPMMSFWAHRAPF